MYYSPVRHSCLKTSPQASVRLACIRHAASVHPEPGSNSPLSYFFQTTLVCLALFYFFNLIDVVFYSFLFSFQCPLTWLSRRVPIYITIPSPFCKAFFLSFFIFFSIPLFFCLYINVFYLCFFVMIKRNDLYRTFLCLMTIWFLYCPGWSLLVRHWSARLSSSLQRFLFLYGPLHFLMLY